jgi:hypothetical protein
MAEFREYYRPLQGQTDEPPARVHAAGLARPLEGDLVGAVLAEQNDEWTESRRCMGTEILAACREAAGAGK